MSSKFSYIGANVKNSLRLFCGLMLILLIACQHQGSQNIREAVQLTNQGEELRKKGNLQAALEKQQEALRSAQKASASPSDTAIILNNLGLAYYATSNYSEALKAFESSVELRRKENNPKDLIEQGKTLANMGVIYQGLGQYSKALEMHQAAFSLFEKANGRAEAGVTLISIGALYRKAGNYQQALATYQKALVLTQESNDLSNQITILNNIGILYEQSLNEPSKALAAYQQALELAKASKARLSEALLLTSIATVYLNTPEQRSQSLEVLKQSLTILKDLGARSEQVAVLSLIAQVFQSQNQPNLAISHYRQAIEITESIRKELGQSSKEQAVSYTKTVSGLYTQLAELLKQEGKANEAQDVLNLLKTQ